MLNIHFYLANLHPAHTFFFFLLFFNAWKYMYLVENGNFAVISLLLEQSYRVVSFCWPAIMECIECEQDARIFLTKYGVLFRYKCKQKN